jgi:Flp pilus assembly protein TadG
MRHVTRRLRPVARAHVGALLRDERGVSMVEFALVAPLLFAFIFGVIDFGRALFLYNNLQDTARRAARLAAVQFPNPCASTTLVRDSARTWVREFNNGRATAYTVDVTCSADLGLVRVTIRDYPFQSIVPVPALRNLRMTQQAGVRFEGANPGL